jgi:glycosyltransferase involved in cell wall biosynthesis
MKIALIAPGPIPAQTANSIQVMKMAQALAEEGHALALFAPGSGADPSWQELSAHYGLSRRFEIRWLPAQPVLRRYDYAFAALRAGRAWGAELIYTRLPQAATLAARRGQATIFELHDLPSGTMGPWLLRRFLQADGARRLVVNTEHLAQEIRKRYRLPAQKDFLVMAPNGVDMQRYAKLPDPKSARGSLRLPDSFTVGYSGHLYAGRGVGLMLELARRLPKIRFLLVGGRSEDVAARKEQAGGLTNVHFIGFVPNAELPLYQAACDVLLIPYSRQVAGSSGSDIAPYTNPLKMFEYLASDRPVLASDLPILREILNEQNAILLPVGELQAWVDALLALQKSPRRRAALAKAGQQTAAEYTWQKRAQRLLRGLTTSG